MAVNRLAVLCRLSPVKIRAEDDLQCRFYMEIQRGEIWRVSNFCYLQKTRVHIAACAKCKQMGKSAVPFEQTIGDWQPVHAGSLALPLYMSSAVRLNDLVRKEKSKLVYGRPPGKRLYREDCIVGIVSWGLYRVRVVNWRLFNVLANFRWFTSWPPVHCWLSLSLSLSLSVYFLLVAHLPTESCPCSAERLSAAASIGHECLSVCKVFTHLPGSQITAKEVDLVSFVERNS